MANPLVSSSKGRSRGAAVGARAPRVRATVIAPTGRVQEFIQAQLERAFEKDDLDILVGALVAVARRRSIDDVETLKAYAFQQVLQNLGDLRERRRIWPWTRLCAARPEIEARELACVLLDSFWKDHRMEVERLTLNMARDEDAEVRQYAAGTMSRIIRANFRTRIRFMQAWSKNSDPSVRRQVIIATVGVADPKQPDRSKPLLDLLEPHLKDRDPYVRRNLGPFALGQGLLRAYPEATLVRFKQWLHSDDEVVRWNLAIALAAASVVPQWEASLEILKVLAADPRRFVWGAASAALANLMGQREGDVGPILRRWMRDPQLRVTVSSALRGTVAR